MTKDEQAEKILKIFSKAGMQIELGAQFSVRGQIAQLLNGCELLLKDASEPSASADSSEGSLEGDYYLEYVDADIVHLRKCR